MTFAGDVPNGWRAQLMRSNDDIVSSRAPCAPAADATADSSGSDLLVRWRSAAWVAASFSARAPKRKPKPRSRRSRSGRIRSAFMPTAKSRLRAAPVRELHNQTMTLTTIREVIA